jgi:hypothetical protein
MDNIAENRELAQQAAVALTQKTVNYRTHEFCHCKFTNTNYQRTPTKEYWKFDFSQIARFDTTMTFALNPANPSVYIKTIFDLYRLKEFDSFKSLSIFIARFAALKYRMHQFGVRGVRSKYISKKAEVETKSENETKGESEEKSRIERDPVAYVIKNLLTSVCLGKMENRLILCCLFGVKPKKFFEFWAVQNEIYLNWATQLDPNHASHHRSLGNYLTPDFWADLNAYAEIVYSMQQNAQLFPHLAVHAAPSVEYPPTLREMEISNSKTVKRPLTDFTSGISKKPKYALTDNLTELTVDIDRKSRH